MDNTALQIEQVPAPYLYRPEVKEFSSGYFDKFLEFMDTDNKTTEKGYRTCLKHFAKWIMDNGITQPTRNDVKAYRASLEASDLAAGTQAQYFRIVKQFFRWTESEGLYRNVAENLSGATVRHDIHKRDALGRDDVARIADTIDRTTETGKRDYAMYMLCITCGLRDIEISRANVEDLQTLDNRLYLYVWGKGHDEADAPVWIVPEVRAAIEDYLNARTTKPEPKSPLFVSTSNNSKGGRIAASTISRIMKKVLVNAGYDSHRLTSHSLRHTSATGCYAATGDIYQTQKHQRHADISTTEIYIHADDRRKRTTELQVYDYFFQTDDEADARAELTDLISSLNPDQVQRVIDFIKSF